MAKAPSTYWGKIAQGLIHTWPIWDTTQTLTCIDMHRLFESIYVSLLSSRSWTNGVRLTTTDSEGTFLWKYGLHLCENVGLQEYRPW